MNILNTFFNNDFEKSNEGIYILDKKDYYAKNVSMKKKKIMIKRKIFVHYVKQKWV